MASNQQFNLRWNNHTNNILQVFMEQFTSENLVDVTLSCQGQFLKAHKMVLSACSPYFQELFRQHQVQHPIIILNGMKFIDIKSVVEFMYRGEIKVLEAEIDGLLAVAETLQVKGLSNVRNKYERGDIQGSEIQESEIPKGDSQEPNDQASLLSSPTHTRRKRRKLSDSQVCATSDAKDEGPRPTSDVLSPAPINPSPQKAVEPFVHLTMNNYADDDDLPATIKVEPPDIRDIDEEPAGGWESPKLIIDIPESLEPPKANSVAPKLPPVTNKVMTKAAGGPTDLNRQKFLMNIPPSNPGPSQDNGALAHQMLQKQRDQKEVTNWLKKRTGKIPRPPNAFMIFANEWRRKLAFQHPNESNKEISVRLGIMWKNLSSDTKETYYTASRLADEEHKRKYPGYYYSPKEARLRKTLKHDLAMARKGPKSLEAMHLVKVLMAEGSEGTPPYLVMQNAQPKEPQAGRRKVVPKAPKPDAAVQEPVVESDVTRNVGELTHQGQQTLLNREMNSREGVRSDVGVTDGK